MGTHLTMKVPEDFQLARDACSYGYFLLHPNRWYPDKKAFVREFSLAQGPTTAAIVQGNDRLFVACNRGLDRAERQEIKRQITRMFRLDETTEHIAQFHQLDDRWKKSGRGRLFRSPTMFEDVIKTVTSCNVTWPSTVQMNRRLCEVLGESPDDLGTDQRDFAFPRPERIAKTRPETLRARCRVGYRDQRIVELARLFSPRGKKPPEMDPAWFEDPATPDEAIHERLLDLPGIGPYAAANIMQLLGRYGRLPLDTESVRHGKTVLGFKGSSARIMKRVHQHYEPFGAHAFRSYWFELWAFYEKKHGPAWTWQRDSTGKLFTAAMLNK